MRFHYGGEYTGDETKLPQREHPSNAVPFQEPSVEQLGKIANIGCVITSVVLAIPVIILGNQNAGFFTWMIGCIVALVSLIPHEFLHAICFKEDVYLFHYLKNGLIFVAGNEDMSKLRFIGMSLCPNIVFGLIPYILFLIFPHIPVLGVIGMLCIGMGFGDYINVYNAIRQMPRNAKTYLSGTKSYWYLPE